MSLIKYNLMIKEEKEGFFNFKSLLIEFLGTLGITYIACWSVIFSDLNKISRNE